MKMKVYRDQQGAIINVGDWDYMIEEIMGKEVIHNPLPEGSVEDTADMERDENGGWRQIG